MLREFKVGDLFDVHPTKAYKLNNSDLLSTVGQTPVVVNSSQNNGIGGYSELEPTEEPGILTFSDTTSGQNTLFYQSQSFIGYSHVQGMYPKNFQFNNLTAMFMVATLRATLGRRKWDYSNKLNRAIVIEMKIQLPVKPGTDQVNYTEDDIDWDYMESYIHELEESYIHELDAYLKETGLDDYELTDAEREVLEHEPMMKEFNVGDLFDGASGDTDIKKEHLTGEGYPVITAGVDNLGIAGYSSINAKILPENSLTVDMFGNCCFRPFEYKMVTHSRVFALTLKNKPLTQEAGLFICTMLKWLQSKYNYSNMCTYNKIKNETIQLPVKPDTDEINYTEDDIDWDYMESYIRAMEKQVIADVVDYKESTIATAKELVYV